MPELWRVYMLKNAGTDAAAGTFSYQCHYGESTTKADAINAVADPAVAKLEGDEQQHLNAHVLRTKTATCWTMHTELCSLVLNPDPETVACRRPRGHSKDCNFCVWLCAQLYGRAGQGQGRLRDEDVPGGMS